MCVIIVAGRDKNIDRETIDRSIVRNPHGWGLVASYPDGRMAVKHGWTKRDAWKSWCLHGGATRTFHARVSTGGKINKNNLHPFNASFAGAEAEERWFFHNGTIRDLMEMDPDHCDSWHAAQYLKLFPTSKHFLDMMSAYAVKNSSRFVLVTPDETWRFGHGWIQKDGVWYSNGSALPTEQRGTSRTFDFEGFGKDLPERTILSDSHQPGLVWDNTMKAYTNLKTAPQYPAHRYRADRSNPVDWKEGDPYRLREAGTTQWWERTWKRGDTTGSLYHVDVKVDGPYPVDALRFHIQDGNEFYRTRNKMAPSDLQPFKDANHSPSRLRGMVDTFNCIRVYYMDGTFLCLRVAPKDQLEEMLKADENHAVFLTVKYAKAVSDAEAEELMNLQDDEDYIDSLADTPPVLPASSPFAIIVKYDKDVVWCELSDKPGELVDLLSIDRKKYQFQPVDEEMDDLVDAATKGKLGVTAEDEEYINSLCG